MTTQMHMNNTKGHTIIVTIDGKIFPFNLKNKILQSEILEDICQKLALNPQEFELRYCNQRLGPYANLAAILPNGAVVHLSPTFQSKTAFIQLLIGDKEDVRSGEFRSSESVWNVIEKLYPDLNSDTKESQFVLFLGKKIVGRKALESTLISDLEPEGGQILLRYFSEFPSKSKLRYSKEQNEDRAKEEKKADIKIKRLQELDSKSEVFFGEDFLSYENSSFTNMSKDTSRLDEHGGMIFLTKALSISHENLRSESFDLPIKRVNEMKTEVRKIRESYYELCQHALPTFDEAHQKTNVMIVFPDNVILQGLFRPDETIGDVMNFIKQYLEYQETEFYLYSIQPKMIMEESETLFEAKCIPRCTLYYGLDEKDVVSKEQSYMKLEYMVNLVEPRGTF